MCHTSTQSVPLWRRKPCSCLTPAGPNRAPRGGCAQPVLPGFASKGGSPGGFRCSGVDGKGIPATFKHRKICRNSHETSGGTAQLTEEHALPCPGQGNQPLLSTLSPPRSWPRNYLAGDCWRSSSPTSCSSRISFGAVHARQERR